MIAEVVNSIRFMSYPSFLYALRALSLNPVSNIGPTTRKVQKIVRTAALHTTCTTGTAGPWSPYNKIGKMVCHYGRHP